MRIAHVLPALTKGGGERIVVELANHAASKGHEVILIAAYNVDPELLQNSIHPKVQLFFVQPADRQKYLHIFSWVKKNIEILAGLDVIHCHLTYGAVFGSMVKLWMRWCKRRRPLLVETYHAVGMGIPRFNRFLHAHLLAGKDAIAFMAEDDYWRRFIQKHTNVLIRNIPNGVSIPWQPVQETAQHNYRKHLGIPHNCEFVVSTVGMLRPDRYPLRYIFIFAKVARQLKDRVHFVIAGSGSEQQNLENLIKENGLEQQVHLAGLALNPSLPFSITTVYVSLCVGPIAGVSMLEASLSGLPVIAIQLSKGYKAKDEDWVWSSEDDIAIANKIITLLSSPDERNEIAKVQSQYVRSHFTTDVMATAYYSLYTEGANKRNALVK